MQTIHASVAVRQDITQAYYFQICLDLFIQFCQMNFKTSNLKVFLNLLPPLHLVAQLLERLCTSLEAHVQILVDSSRDSYYSKSLNISF